MNWLAFLKVVSAVANALSDGQITKDEAKMIVGLIIDLFLGDVLAEARKK